MARLRKSTLYGCRSSKGVTLIELIVVLTILGIAMAAASPSLLRGIDRFSLDSAGHQLVAAFRTARNEARLGQQELLGTFSGGEFVLVRGSQRAVRVRLPASVEVQFVDQPAEYSFLASGQILGPERLELVAGGRYRGVLILGPPPGTVRFEARP
jgi:prepilin-type N-terminal cleavage/methylation domain-containing protein